MHEGSVPRRRTRVRNQYEKAKTTTREQKQQARCQRSEIAKWEQVAFDSQSFLWVLLFTARGGKFMPLSNVDSQLPVAPQPLHQLHNSLCARVLCVIVALYFSERGMSLHRHRQTGRNLKKNIYKKRKCLWVTHLYVRDGRAWNWGFRAPPSALTEAFSRKSLKMPNYHGNAFVCAGDRVTGEQATNPEISLGQRKEGDGRRDGGRLGGRGRGDWRFQKQVIWVSLPVFPARIQWFITCSCLPGGFFSLPIRPLLENEWAYEHPQMIIN